MRTDPYHFGWLGNWVGLNPFQLFFGGADVARDRTIHPLGEKVFRIFVVISWSAVAMTNLPCAYPNAFAQLLDLLLLSLVILLPFRTFCGLCLHIGIVIA